MADYPTGKNRIGQAEKTPLDERPLNRLRRRLSTRKPSLDGQRFKVNEQLPSRFVVVRFVLLPFRFVSFCFVSVRVLSFWFGWVRFVSFRFAWFLSVSFSGFVLFRCVELARCVSFRFVALHFVPFRLVSFRFCSVSFRFVSFGFVSFRSVVLHFVSFRLVPFLFSARNYSQPSGSQGSGHGREARETR